MSWALVIHGGAGSMQRGGWPDDATRSVAEAGLTTALDAAATLLQDGGSALDAVEAAVRVLEDDPAFNAGRGSVFTADGKNECDAAIMDGVTRAAGAVAGVRSTRNPVTLARAVMTDSPHVFLAGQGADAFARMRGVEAAPSEWFATPERRRQLEELLADPNAGFEAGMKYGTVGAVARDMSGQLAAATSTGGMTGKRWGRVGDSPLIGAGTYADRYAAVSCTGAGESFIRLAVAHEICARVRLTGETVWQAADAALAQLDDIGGKGGVIVMGREGVGGWHFNTRGMYRARADGNGGREVAVYGA